jgi:hypothetical protein
MRLKNAFRASDIGGKSSVFLAVSSRFKGDKEGFLFFIESEGEDEEEGGRAMDRGKVSLMVAFPL